MKKETLIPLDQLCSNYSVEMSFFSNLNETGLIEIRKIDQMEYIHQESLDHIEKIIRIYHELELNPEGIDVVFNLLQKIEDLQEELRSVKNRLRLYEQ
jgi:phage terminase small subunit